MTRFQTCTFSIGFMLMGAHMAAGQDFPSKPVRAIAPEPGGNGDLTARVIAQGISGPLGQAVIVESRPSNLIGEAIAKAAPDGYTVGVAGSPAWVTPLLQKASYDATTDFAPITWLTATPHLLVVHPSMPVKSVKELIALARAKPGAINYATGPTGTETHLGGELFKAMAGVNMVRVPYKGTAAGMNALIAGDVQWMLNSAVAATPQVKLGKLRALAVTSAEPSPLAPGLATLASSAGLPGYEMLTILGIFAPTGTPVTIVNRLNQEIVRVLNRPEVKEKFFSLGSEVVGNSPDQFAAKIKSEVTKWSKVIKDTGIKAD